MGLTDKQLEHELLRSLARLERKIDAIGPTPLRRRLDELRMEMRKAILNFDQVKYEGGK